MAGLKDVSLIIKVSQDIAVKVPTSELERRTAEELAPYGIAVRPSAPVVLVIDYGHDLEDFYTTATYKDGSTNRWDSYFHSVSVTAGFFLTTAVLRNGKFYWADVSPGQAFAFWGWTTGIDSPVSTYEQYFSSELSDCLKTISSDHDRSGANNWYAETWTPQKKALINAEFTQLMSRKATMPNRLAQVGPTLNLSGLDTAPRLILLPKGETTSIVNEDSWREAWGQELARAGLVGKTTHPSLSLSHAVWSSLEVISNVSKLYGLEAGAARALSSKEFIELDERDVVFPFNGQMVRSTVTLADFAYTTTCMQSKEHIEFPNEVLAMVRQFGTELSESKRFAPLKTVDAQRTPVAHESDSWPISTNASR